MNPSVTPIKTKWHNCDEFLNGANVMTFSRLSPSCWASSLTSIAKRPQWWQTTVQGRCIRKHIALRRLLNHGKWSSTGLILCRFQILNCSTGVSERHFTTYFPGRVLQSLTSSAGLSIPSNQKMLSSIPQSWLFIYSFIFEKSPNHPLSRSHNTEWGRSKPLDMFRLCSLTNSTCGPIKPVGS